MPNKSKQQKKKQNKKKVVRVATKNIPMAVGSSMRGRPPMLTSVARGVVVRHSEFIADVTSGTSFVNALTGYRINAGNYNLFPWLSGVARNFEKYEFTRLVFKWIPHCATTTPGMVSMAVDYDAADDTPTERKEIMQYKTHVTGPNYEVHAMVCDSSDLRSTVAMRYVLNNSDWDLDGVSYPGNTDRRLYDVGYMWASSESSPSVSTGDLWVDYEVKLIQPEYAKVCTPTDFVIEGRSVSGSGKTDPLGICTWTQVGEAFQGFAKTFGNNRSLLKMPEGPMRIIYESVFGGTGMNSMGAFITDALGQTVTSRGTVSPAFKVNNESGADGTFWQWLVDIPAGIKDAYLAIDANGTTTCNGCNHIRIYPGVST